jgi:hypothetical protein
MFAAVPLHFLPSALAPPHFRRNAIQLPEARAGRPASWSRGWYRKAADQGNASAQNRLMELEKTAGHPAALSHS